MKICHVCAYACDDGTELCPICGAELKEQENNEEINGEAEDIVLENPELAESIEDPITAEIYCDMLKENGILFTSDAGDLSESLHMGFGGFYSEINIYVESADLEKAQEIFNNIEIEEPQFEDCEED